MCQCGCGDIFPIKIIKINNNKYIVVSRYSGCKDCSGDVGYSLYFFDKKGMDEYQLLNSCKIEDIKFDEFGGNEGAGIELSLFDADKLGDAVKANSECPNEDMHEYDSLEEILKEYGLGIVQQAIRNIDKELENKCQIK